MSDPSSQVTSSITMLPSFTNQLPSSSPQPPPTEDNRGSTLSPSNNPPSDTRPLTYSLIFVTVVVCFLFCLLSGIIMLICTYIMHYRRVSKVDEVAARKRSFNAMEIGKTFSGFLYAIQ